ncbi:hypothetical protein BGX34_003354 [Mortierella sp. NVP85]|nr:hypothetical protein BGX34_003354 [Mortierella sp. NVP85]
MATLAPTNSIPCPGHFNDFACALEREILWQGTLYVTATHVCFYGRHFGKTVRVMIDYQDLVSVEKEKKMGVFPSSIRVRVRTPPSSAAASGGEEDTAPTPLPSTKDYVFTSLMSREQAYAIIERNWALSRQVMNSLLSPIMTPGNLSSSGFETPRSDTPDPLERHTTLMFDLDFEARRTRSSGSLRAQRRKSPRTYSVVTDEALSGLKDVDRPALHGRLSSSRLIAVSTMASDTEDAKDGVNGVATDSSAIAGSSSDVDSGPDSGSSSDVNAGADAETVVDGNTAEEATPKVKDSLLTPSSSSSESQKDYVTNAVSSEKQQEATGFRSFIQSRTSQFKRVMSSDGNGSIDHLSPNILEYRQQDVTTTLVPELAYPSPVASSPISIYVSRSTSSDRSGSSNNNGSSNHLNNNHSSSSISGNSRTGGSSTPPPILISPSMTTTKVSHSSSTVQSVAEPGTCRNMSLHLRKESREALLESTRADLRAKSKARAKAAALSKAKAKARRVTPGGPVACNCQRHYKNAVTSTVIPLPLNLCFELLFSGKGVGEGDKLTCDTHRFKDGSTEIKITPWQRGERLAKSTTIDGNAAWEDQKRNLEYSVTFKVPMLAKASTQCLEVQQVVQYNDSLILVHSESRTPNVPYGEQFTTVSQVCMTWESPMRTKIKCFMEVKFKKSIMLASRVESGALEGSGGYLKELIKQLQDLTEAQGPQLIRAWESNNQVEDSSAVDYDTDDSDEDGDTDSDSNTEPELEPDSDDKASTTESTTGANGVIKATGVASHDGVSHTTASTRQGSANSLLSVTRRPVATEMSRAQSLLSQQFLRSAPPTIATDTVRAGAPARLSLDSARPENVGVSTRDPLTPLLPSERKSALAMLWENFTPPIITVAAAALAFNESKGSLTSASTEVATKGAVLKEDVTLPSTTTTSMTTTTATTTIATNIPIAPTAVTAAAPAVAVGASSSPVWGEFVRRGLTFFGKAAGQDGNPSTLGKTGHSATRKDRSNDDTSSLSSVSTSSDSYDDSVSRPDGVRVKFALPAGSRRSHSKSVDDGRKGGKHGRSNGSSSVRSTASVPSLGSTFREQGQRSNGRHLGSQSEDQDLTKTQSSGPLSPQRNNGRPWVLSRIVFAFLILGMVITALNVWHLLSVVSSVVEVVEQRNDFSSNSRLHAQLFLRQQHQHRAYSSSFSSLYQQYPSQRYLEAWERYRQQRHYRDPYYYYQQQQAWENDEDYKSLYQYHPDPEDHDSSAQHVEEPPASTPVSVSTSDLPSSAQPNAPWEEEVEKEGHAQKVQLKAQIEELLAMLEHAREELRQSKAQS